VSGAAGRHADALARARRFVVAAGDSLDVLRLDGLGDAEAAAGARAGVERCQQPDGDFGPLHGAKPPGPVAATREGLAAMADLRVRHAAALERAVAWLAAAQAPDGSWGDSAPGVDRFATTGLLGGLLGAGVYVRPASLEAAGAFLDAQWSPDLVQNGAWERITATCAFFTNVEHERADEALQWAGRELERGFRGGVFDGVRTARVFTRCGAVSLPGARLDPFELVASVLAGQGDDGGWGDPGDSAAARVATTLDAAVALVRLPS
jgi:hypothetical protein